MKKQNHKLICGTAIAISALSLAACGVYGPPRGDTVSVETEQVVESTLEQMESTMLETGTIPETAFGAEAASETAAESVPETEKGTEQASETASGTEPASKKAAESDPVSEAVSDITVETPAAGKADETEHIVFTEVSGSFTATLQELMPDYVLDDFSNRLAVVELFQGPAFTLQIGDLGSMDLETGQAYVFTVEPKTFEFSGSSIIRRDNTIAQFMNITDIRHVNEGETGLASLNLDFTDLSGQDAAGARAVNARVSGTFSAILRALLPDYGIDMNTGYAVVQIFQGPCFMIHVRDLDTSALEIGKYYDFTVAPVNYATDDSSSYINPGIAYYLEITDIAPGEHFGLEGRTLHIEMIAEQ